MARFSKRKPDTVIVKDRKLICPVCDNDLFIETRTPWNAPKEIDSTWTVSAALQ